MRPKKEPAEQAAEAGHRPDKSTRTRRRRWRRRWSDGCRLTGNLRGRKLHSNTHKSAEKALWMKRAALLGRRNARRGEAAEARGPTGEGQALGKPRQAEHEVTRMPRLNPGAAEGAEPRQAGTA